MRMLLRSRAWKVGIGAFGGLCLAAGIAAAAAPPSNAVTATQFVVDHQLCYTAAGHFGKVPVTGAVTLTNQFSPGGFAPQIGHNIVLHCNPVIKTVVNGGGIGIPAVTPVTNPAVHLACFRIFASQQPEFVVGVQNQFGVGYVSTGQPDQLCLPTWKSLKALPNKKPTTPPGLSHFTCYPVLIDGNNYSPPAAVLLQDEFSKKPVSANPSPVPSRLCVPTMKTVGSRVFPILDPVTSLLCFPETKTPRKPVVYDENQFGRSVVKIIATSTLCVPSTMQVIRPVAPHPGVASRPTG